MQGLKMCDSNIIYIFCKTDSTLREHLNSFWNENILIYIEEMDTYHPVGTFHKRNVTTNILLTNKPAAIACDKSGKIIGVIFVSLRALNKELNLGRFAYFQRMYVIKNFRNSNLAYRLNQTFLEGFIPAKGTRDHRAKHLILEIANPRLQNSFIRKYLDRSGFRLMGSNMLNAEIWSLSLETTYNL